MYDFETTYQRQGHDSLAVDGVGKKKWGMEPPAPKAGFDVIPMWISDMNFACCPSILDAIRERLNHPIFGYFDFSDEFYEAIETWHRHCYGASLNRQWVGYDHTIHGGIGSALEVFTHPGDGVLVFQPCYPGFIKDIECLGRHVVYCPMGDLDLFEACIVKHQVKAFILCNPHNPTGHVYTKEELKQFVHSCRRHQVVMISDEVWCDLAYQKHTPLYELNDQAICFYAINKGFNLAGFQGAYHVVKDDRLRKLLEDYSYRLHYNKANVLWMHALIGAYSVEGRCWLEALKEVLKHNIHTMKTFLEGYGISSSPVEAGYMLFIDLKMYSEVHHISVKTLLNRGYEVGIAWRSGEEFHAPNAIRLNVALTPSQLQEVLKRLAHYVLIDTIEK